MKKKLITVSFITLFSILLWVFVSFSGEFSINLKLPIEIINVPDGYSLSSVSAREVSLSLKGQGWQLAQHTLGRNPHFRVISSQNPGVHTISSRNALESNTWLSSSLQIVELIPEKIDIAIEKIISKKVPITPILSLNYKPGYGIVSLIKLIPDSVIISGPRSIVRDIKSVNSKATDFNIIEKNVNERIDLVQIEYLKFNRNFCTVNFEVQKIVDKTFENIIVEARNTPRSYDLVLSPGKIKVVLRGGINILSKIREEDIKPYVMFRQALADTVGSIEPYIDIPDFTSLIDKKPHRLDYIIKKY